MPGRSQCWDKPTINYKFKEEAREKAKLAKLQGDKNPHMVACRYFMHAANVNRFRKKEIELAVQAALRVAARGSTNPFEGEHEKCDNCNGNAHKSHIFFCRKRKNRPQEPELTLRVQLEDYITEVYENAKLAQVRHTSHLRPFVLVLSPVHNTPPPLRR